MLKIYGVPVSAHTRKVIVTCIEKGLEHEVVPVIPLKPPVGWAEKSPRGTIPVIEDGDLTLADSSVICAYLDRAYAERPIVPQDPSQYARTLWLEEYVDGALQDDVLHGFFFERIIKPKLLGEETDTAKVDDVVKNRIPPQLDYLQAAIAGDFAVGNGLSVADIAIASILLNYQYAGGVIDPSRHGQLLRYLRGILRLPAFAKALEREAPFVAEMGLERGFLDDIAA